MSKKRAKRRSAKDLLDIIKTNLGPDYVYISGYKNFTSPINILHKKCNKRFSIVLNSIKERSTCKRCSGKERNKNDLKLLVKEKMGNEFTYIDGYENSYSYINVKHKICKRTLSIQFSKLNISRCAFCSFDRWDLMKAKDLIKNKLGIEYEYNSEFKDAKTKFKLKHKLCGNIFPRTISHLKQSLGCPVCEKIRHLSPNEYEKRLHVHKGNEFELISHSCSKRGKIEAKSYVKVLHKKCNNLWKVRADFIYLNGKYCFHCNPSKLKDTPTYKKEVKELVGSEFKVLDEYLNGDTPIEHVHLDCGHHFLVSPRNFKISPKCPIKCEFSEKPRADWKNHWYPYPIKVKPEKVIRIRPYKKAIR